MVKIFVRSIIRWQNGIDYDGYDNDVLHNSSNANSGNDNVNHMTFLPEFEMTYYHYLYFDFNVYSFDFGATKQL